jgi:hypothetical protein
MLAIANEVNLLGDKRHHTEKPEVLTNISNQIGLKVKTEKTHYMLVSHHQNTGKIHDITMANTSSENVAQFFFQNSNKIKPNSG